MSQAERKLTALASWRQRMGISQRAAAQKLGVSLSTYQDWEHERNRLTGAHVPPPRTALLAAAAVEAGIKPVNS